jgi:hypothetical protein
MTSKLAVRGASRIWNRPMGPALVDSVKRPQEDAFAVVYEPLLLEQTRAF